MTLTRRRLVCAFGARPLLNQVNGYASPTGVHSLLRAVRSSRDDDWKFGAAAIEAGESAVDELVQRIRRSTDETEQENAASALVYIGGSKAADALHAFYLRTNLAKTLVCFAYPSAPSPSRIAFLIDALRGPHYGDEWYGIVQSAWSLGIIRAQNALGELRKCADLHEGMASAAAAQAIGWITSPPMQTTIEAPADCDDLLLAALVSGVPQAERIDAMVERKNGRVWVKTSSGISIRGPQDAVGNPERRVQLECYKSKNGERALLNIGLRWANLDGAGYEYILRKHGAKWTVCGMAQTWVS